MIKENLAKIKSKLPDHVNLVAVSKTKPKEDILEAYHAGHRIFGENKVQELVEKHELLPQDIDWHMIGHLQRNKVKYIIPFVALIHGVDSLRLLKEIEKQSAKINRVQNILLQVHIADENTKFGLDEKELVEILNQLTEYPHVKVLGLMGMATFSDDQQKIASEFEYLHSLFLKYQPEYQLTTLSMGMSNDFEIAIQNGSNMIRVGSSIFGERNY